MLDLNNFPRTHALGTQKTTTRSGWGNIAGYAWIVFAVFGFFILLIEQSRMTQIPREVAMRVTKPSLYLAENIVVYQKNISLWWVFIRHGAEHLAKAENEISQLTMDAAYIQMLEKENAALQKEVGRTLSGDWILAEWYGSPTQWFIDAGCRSGVEVGSVVTKDRAFVGVVSAVYDRYSEVRTWDDSSWRLAVKVGDESVRGVFSVGGGYPEVREIPMPVDIPEYLVGEPVITSGQETVPPNRLLGTVHSSQSESGFGTVRLVIDPIVEFSNLQFVSVDRNAQVTCELSHDLSSEGTL